MIEFGPGAQTTLDDIVEVARRGAKVGLAAEAWSAVEASQEFMRREADSGRRIYGITTGFGPLADHHLHPQDAGELQRNLVYHLATGVGEPFARDVTRAIMATRLAALARGYSAVDPKAVRLVAECLNIGLEPVVPSLGTVGASGDLTPLAHIALALMGEAAFWESDLAAHGLDPLEPAGRECLGLVNGTAAMTGLAALNGADAMQAWELALSLAAANAEVFEARAEAFDSLLGDVRPHLGQVATLEGLDARLRGAQRLVTKASSIDMEKASSGPTNGHMLAQDPYTIRCVPQVFGAIHDVISNHNATVETELRSVTDNPLFDAANERIIHGGNFMGQHVAFASDALHNALVQLAVHSERVVARLVDTRRNGDLPPFLQGQETGLHSGFMGAQVTATALVAHLRTHATPASIQSIATNADNQDIVSMGTIGALRTWQSMQRVFEVLAIEAMVVVQAMELSGGDYSPHAKALAETVRSHVPTLRADRPLSDEITQLAAAFRAER